MVIRAFGIYIAFYGSIAFRAMAQKEIMLGFTTNIQVGFLYWVLAVVLGTFGIWVLLTAINDIVKGEFN